MAGDVKGNRVGGSIDMSVDLANASHFDVNDASQGFSVWTEEMPGVADNWYFVSPTYMEFWLTAGLLRVLPSNFVMARQSAGMVV